MYRLSLSTESDIADVLGFIADTRDYVSACFNFRSHSSESKYIFSNPAIIFPKFAFLVVIQSISTFLKNLTFQLENNPAVRLLGD